ncbi:MAG TPA: RNA 3'-terminal phosphate cyclase, partial [Phycisphaerales bacterium]|nr:RNA 3'-terminal phosphate cyclase [Phycisphaerales bacterium]
VLEGGTHNVMAPPFDFIERAFLPLMDRMGPRVAARAERLGFYPGGGGRVVVDIEPAARLGPLHVLERGAPVSRRGTALIARLPVHIAERELGVLAEVLGWASDDLVVRDASSRSGPGNAVLVELAFEQVTEVFSAIGARGRPAEAVAQQAASEARAYLQSGAPVGPHLADQLLLPLALAGAGSFRTVPLTEHSVTNMRTIGRFLPVRFRTRAEGPDVLVMAGSDEPGGGR